MTIEELAAAEPVAGLIADGPEDAPIKLSTTVRILADSPRRRGDS